MQTREDPYQGLSGISISTDKAGQTVSLEASGEALEIFYLQQPGGGKLELQVDDQIIGTITTDGDSGPGSYKTNLESRAASIAVADARKRAGSFVRLGAR